MKNNIQMIKISDDNSLYIIGFDDKKMELTFRVTRNHKQIQKENILIKDNMVYTNLYHFPLDYLNKFINENKTK